VFASNLLEHLERADTLRLLGEAKLRMRLRARSIRARGGS
jgi:hypothetical protein